MQNMNEKFLFIGFFIIINIMDVTPYMSVIDADSLSRLYADIPNLWQLDISNQTSFELPKHRAVLNHKKLTRFRCNNCSIHSVYKQSFSLLPQLTYLELDYNNLSYIDPDAFESNKLLHKLQLIGNNLVKFNSEAMLRQASLSYLIMDHNPMFNINDVKIQMPWLSYFSCKHCSALRIKKSTLAQWKRIGHLHLSYNKINQIDPDSFEDLVRFKHLNVDGNFELDKINFESKTLLHLSAENCGLQGKLDISRLRTLEYLNVRKNKISNIEDHGFRYNKNIRKILLDDNEIEKIPEKLLETPLYELEALCIDRNPLQPRELLRDFINKYNTRKLRRGCMDDDFRLNMFEHKLPLKTGKALYRKLSNINVDNASTTFDKTSEDIVYIESMFFKDLTNVSTVILDNNINLTLPVNVFFLQSQFIKNLSLANCAIIKIYDETFHELPNIRSINLRGNKIHSIRSYLIFRRNKLIENVDLSKNKLNFIPSDVFEELQYLQTLNLEHNQLFKHEPRTPFLISSSLQFLNLQQCNFEALDDITLSGLPNLKQLNLSQNIIKSVSANSFGRTNFLELLDLSNNNIKSFQPDLKEFINLEQMCLSGNSDFNFSSFEKYALKQTVDHFLDLEQNCPNATFSKELQEYYKSMEVETFQTNQGGLVQGSADYVSSGSLFYSVDISLIFLMLLQAFYVFN